MRVNERKKSGRAPARSQFVSRRWSSRCIGMVVLLAASVLGLPSAGLAQGAASDQQGRLTSGGIVRTYEIHIPSGRAPVGGFPVVLVFHGGGGRGSTMSKLTGFDALADERGFIAVYPDGVDKHWNDGRTTIKHPVDDVGFIAAMLDQIGRSYQIDRRRVFATGISNGALFSERLGCQLSDRIAAIAPVAGTLPVDIAGSCRPARHVAVLQIDGTSDPIMPYAGGNVADFGGRGEGGTVLSVQDTAAFWARQNGCGRAGRDIPLRPTRLLDRTRVSSMSFVGCPADGAVTVLSVEGGGHTWPGGSQYAPAFIIGKASRQLDASSAIADFFLADRR